MGAPIKWSAITVAQRERHIAAVLNAGKRSRGFGRAVDREIFARADAAVGWGTAGSARSAGQRADSAGTSMTSAYDAPDYRNAPSEAFGAASAIERSVRFRGGQGAIPALTALHALGAPVRGNAMSRLYSAKQLPAMEKALTYRGYRSLGGNDFLAPAGGHVIQLRKLVGGSVLIRAEDAHTYGSRTERVKASLGRKGYLRSKAKRK